MTLCSGLHKEQGIKITQRICTKFSCNICNQFQFCSFTAFSIYQNSSIMPLKWSVNFPVALSHDSESTLRCHNIKLVFHASIRPRALCTPGKHSPSMQYFEVLSFDCCYLGICVVHFIIWSRLSLLVRSSPVLSFPAVRLWVCATITLNMILENWTLVCKANT